MTNKILTIALVFTACMFVLCGCSGAMPSNQNITYDKETDTLIYSEEIAKHQIIADEQFEKITVQKGGSAYDYNRFVLFRDRYTDVMYISARGKYECNFTVMVKPDGSPMLYCEWIELYNGKTIEEIMVEPTEEVVTETIPEVTEEYTEPTEETYAADYSIDLDEWEE